MKHNKNLIVLGVSRSGQHFILDQLYSWDTSYNICKFENAADTVTFNQKIKTYELDMELPTKILVIHRDYPNWLASLVKYVNEREKHVDEEAKYNRIKEYIKHWKDVHNFNYDGDVLHINYNSFASKKSYREFVCNNLNGTYSEKSLTKVPIAGGGSSFSGVKYDDIAAFISSRKSQILNTEYKDEYMEHLLEDREALELHLKSF